MSLLISLASAFGGLVAILYVAYSVFKDTVAFGKVRNMFELFTMLITVRTHAYTKNGSTWSYVDRFEDLVDKKPDVTQLIFVENDEYVSRRALDTEANQIGHWAHGDKVNLRQKDTVAFMMLNRREYIAFWLGVSKVGVRTALLNTNLTGKAFLHSVNVAVADSVTKAVVIDDELCAGVKDELVELEKSGVKVFIWSDVATSVKTQPTSRPSRSLRCLVKESDPFLYIYTSGTTGLPKASKISHTRFYFGGVPTATFLYLKPGSRVYNCLPLYHSAAGMMGAGGVLNSGATLVVRKKFSVRAWTADILKYKCDAVQYIGELCRYLINSPPNPDDEKLNISYALGNGMRPDVWVKFQERYHVKRIVEFYGATEGNCTLFNSTGKVGALGYIVPSIAKILYPLKIVKVDENDKSIPLRDPKTGFCKLVSPMEPGLIINTVNNKVVQQRFDGYSDAEATKKKLLTDVFKKGDMFFNSGDLLAVSEDGFYFWSDRVGDTFRWKGENVATTEVAEGLSGVPGFSDITIYGVPVPDCDGKVGMACVQLKDGLTAKDIDWAAYHREVSAHLPVYARPAFIRISPQMALTSTFKHQKGDLVKDGYNVEAIKDEVYLYSAKDGSVVPLTKELVRKINDGSLKL